MERWPAISSPKRLRHVSNINDSRKKKEKRERERERRDKKRRKMAD
jgi:hypothetical protein